MKNVLFIDLEQCRACRQCKAPCSYGIHRGNDGVRFVRETAEFAADCRRCSDPPCVKACPSGALEQTPDGRIQRHADSCVSCKTCCYACPFGVLVEELIRLPDSKCDFCVGRLKAGEKPLCVGGCSNGAIQYGEFTSDPGLQRVAIGENLVVHMIPWGLNPSL